MKWNESIKTSKMPCIKQKDSIWTMLHENVYYIYFHTQNIHKPNKKHVEINKKKWWKEPKTMQWILLILTQYIQLIMAQHCHLSHYYHYHYHPSESSVSHYYSLLHILPLFEDHHYSLYLEVVSQL